MGDAARLLIPGLFALALSAGPALAAEFDPSPLAPPDPPVLEPLAAVVPIPDAPLGLDIAGTRYSLLSNATWKNAKQVKRIHTRNPDAGDAYFRQNYGFLWGDTCLPSEQKVVLQRDYYMPGPPKNFAARIWTTKYYGIKEVRVYINGKFAFAKQKLPEFITDVVPLTENVYPKMFKNGNNEIRIEATKFADTTSKLCKFTPLGIAFELYGEFSADLQGSGQPGQYQYAKHVAAGATEFQISNAPQIRNLGPSGAYHATFVTDVGSGGFQVSGTELIPLGNSIAGCELFTNKRRMECEITRWAKGTAQSFPSGIKVKLSPSSTYKGSYVRVTYGVGSSTIDPNASNNNRTATYYICYPGSDHSTCSLPPP